MKTNRISHANVKAEDDQNCKKIKHSKARLAPGRKVLLHGGV